jgi:serine protease inhibitor
LAVWARPFAFHSYGELTKKKKQKKNIQLSMSHCIANSVCLCYRKSNAFWVQLY